MSPAPRSGPRPRPVDHPEAHRRFSLGEDWTATILGLIVLGLCLLGAVSPELIP